MLRVVTALAALVAALVALLPPAAYLAFSYRAERAILITEAEINARLVSQIISTNPHLWEFESGRLEDLLRRRPDAIPVPESRSVANARGTVIAQTSGAGSGPLISQVTPVHDSGRVVGTLTISRSLQPLLAPALLVALVSFVLAAGAFFALRSLPLRAMQAALDRARHEHERALESEARFRMLWQTSNDAIVILDVNSRITYVNPAVENILGWEPGALVGQDLSVLQPPELAAAHRTGMSRYLESGQRRLNWQGVETTAMRRNGEQFPVEIVFSELAFSGERMFAGFIRDITARKAAQHQIEELNQSLEQRVAERTAELQAVNEEMEAFSYSVSHDLRAPLRHINGFAQMLLEDNEVVSPDGKEHLQRIHQASVRMGKLIDDLLEMSQTGHAPLALRPLRTRELILEVRDECMRDCPERVIEWRIGAVADVLADDGLLRVVLVNLIGNAIKFTGKAEAASIEISQLPGKQDEVVICIRDNGAGFDMRYLDKLFGVFQRLHSNAEFGGTGIGLATVRRVMRRLGGRVWAEGLVGQGAAFFVSLKPAGESASQDLAKAELARADRNLA